MEEEKKEKRYWLFGNDTYYPSGGMEDFIDSFHTLEAAEVAVKNQEYEFDRHYIYDRKTGKTKTYY